MSDDIPSPAETATEAPEVPQAPVPQPQQEPLEPEPGFGWTTYAERLNGRFAMLGFVLLLLLELFTHQDFLTWLGLR
jgi:hypothetical protein